MIAAMGLAAAIGIVAVVSFGVFLATKELAGANHRSGSSARVARFLNVGIWPLAIAFGAFVAMKVAPVLV